MASDGLEWTGSDSTLKTANVLKLPIEKVVLFERAAGSKLKVHASTLSCVLQPQRALCSILMPYIRLGCNKIGHYNKANTTAIERQHTCHKTELCDA